MFVGIGLAETPVILGLLAALLLGEWWVFVPGLAFGLWGLARVAPSRRNIERREEQLRSTGQTLSLLESLRLPRPPTAGSA